MNYFACPLHNGHFLSLVCQTNLVIQTLQSVVRISSDILTICENTDHQSQNTLPIKLMLQQVDLTANNNSELTQQSILDVSLFLDKSYNECLRAINQFNEQILNRAKLLSKKVETYYLDLKNQLLIFQTLKLQFNFYLILLTFLQNDLSTKKILIKFHQSYLDKFQNNIHLEMVQLADKVQIKKQWWLVSLKLLSL